MLIFLLNIQCMSGDANSELPRTNPAIGMGLELGASELQVQRFNQSATLPPHILLQGPVVRRPISA